MPLLEEKKHNFFSPPPFQAWKKTVTLNPGCDPLPEPHILSPDLPSAHGLLRFRSAAKLLLIFVAGSRLQTDSRWGATPIQTKRLR